MKRMLALLMTLMLLLGLCACGAGSSGASGDTAASSSGGASNEMNSTDSGWDNGSTQDAPQESEARAAPRSTRTPSSSAGLSSDPD